MIMEELAKKIRDCDQCSLKDMPHVLWRGSWLAKLMIVGEAPGKHEHLQGKPWVGPAGQELDKALAALGIDTDKDCFITNVVKARPVSTTSGKQNDTPQVNNIRTCSDLWLKQEIALIKPKVIVCMGKSAAVGMGVIKSSVPMGAANGIELWYDGIEGGTKVFVTYHTASYLHMSSDAKFTEQDIVDRKWLIFNVLKRAVEAISSPA